MVAAVGWILQALVFLSELAALAAIGFGGYHLTHIAWIGWILAAVLVAIAIGAWACGAAPSAPATNEAVRWGVRVLVFTAGAVLLAAAGHPRLAGVFGVASVIIWGLSVVVPDPTDSAAR